MAKRWIYLTTPKGKTRHKHPHISASLFVICGKTLYNAHEVKSQADRAKPVCKQCERAT